MCIESYPKRMSVYLHFQKRFDFTLKWAESNKMFLSEKQVEVEASLKKDKELYEIISKSSRQLSSISNSTVSGYVQCIESELNESSSNQKMNSKYLNTLCVCYKIN